MREQEAMLKLEIFEEITYTPPEQSFVDQLYIDLDVRLAEIENKDHEVKRMTWKDSSLSLFLVEIISVFLVYLIMNLN
ncbi:hypothetical protein [Peribacillus loiseleuriae]|uniref:Uncharacterized protein n=1 Tax=Peribacillus loiseleuriae TaxID=1679170 RepID=A0A0K9G919_9BACI|nr:hypothetical protein [Peribacillus loiseleuriae]KMY42737.1 hypothetical protein AC625_24085 [Peribacillus loiseleuriae]